MRFSSSTLPFVSSTLLLLSSHSLAVPIDSTTTDNNDNSTSNTTGLGYVKFVGERTKVSHSTMNTIVGKDSSSSSGSLDVSLQNEDFIYVMNVTIGSNKEQIQLQIDTGSSDFWVIGSNNTWCETGGDSTHDCSIYGTFDASKSTTWKDTGVDFSIVYQDGTGANGTWGTDNVEISGVDISDVYIAVSDEASENFGVLGIGYRNDESTADARNENPFTYDNLPISLKNQGLISKNAYSIYLDDKTQTNTANLLFGAIDHSKYYGRLGLIPIASDSTELDIILNSVSLHDNSDQSDRAMAKGAQRALLDSELEISH
ncbi:unnamed protein product [Ambrosiozyma monospora]|uniref:Unnamed protein product n=1 Tax=Ambrosiozyma monospora TaxID=43982 RepID=A0ACB5UDU8_AMBMO|nr:unnamed protein product [Ambrosiozyma monospora]